MSTHPSLALAGLALLSSALAGCGEERVQGFGDPTDPVAGEYVGNGPARLFPAGSAPIRLTLRGGEISFTASCNHFSGQATWDDTLRTGALGGTEMGCPGTRQKQDEWMVRFFGSSPALEMDGTDLAVRSDKDRVFFVPADEVSTEVPGDAGDLVGTPWKLTGMSERDRDSIGMMVIPDDVLATIRFEDDEFTVHTGCNTGGGPAVVEGDAIRFGEFAVTLLPCAGAAAEVERGVTRVLADTVSWSITEDELRLGTSDGRHELVFHR